MQEVRVPEGQFKGTKVRVRVLHIAAGKRKDSSPASSGGSKRSKR